MIKKRKIPMRKCVVSNERKEKKELIRVVRNSDGVVSVDLTGKANGRGAYLSKDAKVIKTAMKKKTLERHLDVSINDSIYEELLEIVKNDDE